MLGPSPGHIAFAAALALGALAGACLEPGNPYLAERDNEPPRFVESIPEPGGVFDKDAPILVTFSEEMDIRSLRPGIWLVKEQERVPVIIEVPEDDAVPEAAQQSDIPYTISVRGAEPLEPNAEYLLVLDTVLTDTEGNQLVGPDGGLSQRVLSYRTNP